MVALTVLRVTAFSIDPPDGDEDAVLLEAEWLPDISSELEWFKQSEKYVVYSGFSRFASRFVCLRAFCRKVQASSLELGS